MDHKVEFYNTLSASEFREIGLQARNEITESKEIIMAKLKIINLFKKIFYTEQDYLASSYFAFFPTRNLPSQEEQLDFHRETTYAGDKKPYHGFQYNIWIPVFDVEKNQNLFFVPKSHLIKDKDIKTINIGQKADRRTASHTLGYAYWPKKIVGGVDLEKAERFEVPKDKFLLFDGNLIHGSGSNKGNTIRFAMTFGIIEKKKFIDNQNYITFRSNNPTFTTPTFTKSNN